MTEEVLRMGNLPKTVVHLERVSENRADIALKVTARIRHVIIGKLPHVKITNLIRHANSAKSTFSTTMRFTISPARSRRRVVEKDLLTYLKNSKQLSCVFQRREQPKSKSISRKVPICLGPKRSVPISKDTQRHVKCGKKRVHLKVLFSILNLMNVALCSEI